MELGAMTNLFRDRRGGMPGNSYIEQARLCAAAGFKVLDLNVCDSVRPGKSGGDDLASEDWEAKIEALGNEAAKLGVRFTQAHAPYNGDLFIRGRQPDEDYLNRFHEMSRRCVIAAGRLGIKRITIHPMSDTVNTEYDNEIQKKTNIEFYAPMMELARKCGTGLALENMADFDRAKVRRAYCADADDLIDIVDTVSDPVLGVCWDFGHARMMINDQPRQLRKLGRRLVSTHVQDGKGARDTHLVPFVGGNIRWEEIMPCLKEIGYEGDFVLETHQFMNEVPDKLRLSAGMLAYDFGMYCMELYNKA
jgi:sugar phosphate isomerase/epimerase